MLLRTQGLAKRFERKGVCVDALKGIDLEIDERAFVTVTGPSGSGKTTLLLTLAGLLKPTGGSVRFRDTQLFEMILYVHDMRLCIFILAQDAIGEMRLNRTVEIAKPD